jgi:hypothetical protein
MTAPRPPPPGGGRPFTPPGEAPPHFRGPPPPNHPPPKGHRCEYSMDSFLKPSWCQSRTCGKFLVGIVLQGQRCRICQHILCHACAKAHNALRPPPPPPSVAAADLAASDSKKVAVVCCTAIPEGNPYPPYPRNLV